MRNSFILIFLIGGLFFTGLAGCQTPTPPPVSAKSIDEGRQFVEKLKAMPAAERQAYATKNQTIVQNLNGSGDQQLVTEFRQLMMESGKR